MVSSTASKETDNAAESPRAPQATTKKAVQAVINSLKNKPVKLMIRFKDEVKNKKTTARETRQSVADVLERTPFKRRDQGQDEVTKIVAPKKPKDYLSCLPNELYSHISRHFFFDDRICVSLTCRRLFHVYSYDGPVYLVEGDFTPSLACRLRDCMGEEYVFVQGFTRRRERSWWRLCTSFREVWRFMPVEKLEKVLAEVEEDLVAPQWTWERLPKSLRPSGEWQVYWCGETGRLTPRDARMEGRC